MGLLNNRRRERVTQENNEKNRQSAERINQANIDWQKEYYDKTNAYNTPQMQMQRFKEAGLNPHLIYGQGTPGNTTMPTPPQQGYAESKAYLPESNFTPIAETAMAAAQAYVGMKKQQAEIDNTEAATQVQLAQKDNVDSQTVANYSSTAKTNQETQQASQAWGTKLATFEAGLKNLNTQTASIEQQIKSSQAGERLTEAQIGKVASDIKQTTEQIKLLKMQGNTQALDQELKQLDINLRKQGINPQDPTWLRILGQEFGDIPNKIRNMKMPWDDATQKKYNYQNR